MTTYAQYSLALISLYTIFPAVVLHAGASGQLRRAKFRMGVWVLLGSIVIVNTCLLLSTRTSAVYGHEMAKDAKAGNEAAVQELHQWMNKVKDSESQNMWEFDCVDEDVVDAFLGCIFLVLGTLALFAAFYAVIIKNLFRTPLLRSKGRPRLSRFRRNWWWVSGFLAFLAMWLCLAMFLYFRKAFNKRAGSLNKDHEWGFGQIMALATWVPVLIQLIFIGKEGAVSALTGELSGRYQVVPAPEDHRHDTNVSLLPVETTTEYQPVARVGADYPEHI